MNDKVPQKSTYLLYPLSFLLSISMVAMLSACVGPPASHWAKQTVKECPWEPDDTVTTEIRIAYQGIPNGDLIVKDQGILEACLPKATISWKRFNSGTDVLQGFGSGSLDLGIAGSSLMARGLSDPLNLDLVVPWIFDVIGDAESLVVHENHAEKITSIEDLKGRSIAVPFGSTSHFSLLSALNMAGINPHKDVTLINLSPDKMMSAWNSQDIDAAWVWEPTLSVLAKEGRIIDSSARTAEQGAPTYDMSVVRREFFTENPRFMYQWGRAQDYAAQFIRDHPSSAASSMAVQLGAQASDVEKQLHGYSYPLASEQAGKKILGDEVGKSLIKTAQFLSDNGEIPHVGEESLYRSAVDPTIAEAVASHQAASH